MKVDRERWKTDTLRGHEVVSQHERKAGEGDDELTLTCGMRVQGARLQLGSILLSSSLDITITMAPWHHSEW